MKDQRPCPEWAEKLTTRHSKDLPLSERAALNKHIESCSACANVSKDYDAITARVRAVTTSELSPGLTPELFRLREGIAAQRKPKEQASSFSRLGPGDVATTFSLCIFIVMLVVGVALGSSFLLQSNNSNSNNCNGVNNCNANSTPPARVTSPVVSPPATLTPTPSIYLHMAASYAGTVVDLLSKKTTAMFLTNIQQSQGNIHGFFQGLGLAGPFAGTVTSAGHVQFTVTVSTSEETIVFEGDIKIGGDIVGNFTVLDRHGYRTGESGLWNVAARP